MRPALSERGFSTTTAAMFGQKQTIMLHLFTATNIAWWSVFGQALIVTFHLGLVILTTQCADLPCVSGGKVPKMLEEIHLSVRRNIGSGMAMLRLTLHIRSENISPPLTTVTGLDRAGQWLGLPGHQTSHQGTSSYGAILKP